MRFKKPNDVDEVTTGPSSELLFALAADADASAAAARIFRFAAT